MPTIAILLACLIINPSGTWHIVDEDQVVIRSGADRNFYGFLEAPRGSVVEVTDVLNNWGRIPARGPLFEHAWGWIRHSESEPGRFQFDGETQGIALDKLPVYAPDLSSDNPARAWRQLCIIPEDTTLEVLSTTTREMDGRPFRFYRVRLPEQADGWINMANLRVALPDELGNQMNVGQLTTEGKEEGVEEQEVVELTSSIPPRGSTGRPSYLARYLAEQDRLSAVKPPQNVEVVEVIEVVEVDIRGHSKSNRVNRYFQGLEKIYNSLPATDMTEDLAARLRDGYQMVAIEDAKDDPEVAALATIRLRQLDLALCLREERRALEKLDAVVDVASSDVIIMKTILEDPTSYSVLGRLNVSSIFTGSDGRPVMYRIEDPLNGRTLAYVNPDSSLLLSEWIGQMIGVIGSMEFDNHWQVQVVDPNRIDLVAAVAAGF